MSKVKGPDMTKLRGATDRSPLLRGQRAKEVNQLQPEVVPYTSLGAKKMQKVNDPNIPSFKEFQKGHPKTKPKVEKVQQKDSEKYMMENDSDPRETYNVSATGTFNGRFTNTGENKHAFEDDEMDYEHEVIEEEEFTQYQNHGNSMANQLDRSDKFNQTQHFENFPKKNQFTMEERKNFDKIAMFK